MTISERMFSIMEEKGITRYRLSKLTGISVQTIYDWKKKHTNPGADKIMLICDALEITPEELLRGTKSEDKQKKPNPENYMEMQLLDDFRQLSERQQRRLRAYIDMLYNSKE